MLDPKLTEAFHIARERYNRRATKFIQYGDQLPEHQWEQERAYLGRERVRLEQWKANLVAQERAEQRRAAAAQYARKTGKGFLGLSFRAKFGVLGLALTVLGFAFGFTQQGIGMTLFVPGAVLLIIWFLMGVLGVGVDRRRSGEHVFYAPNVGGVGAVSPHLQDMLQRAEARAAEDEAKDAEAEQRHREAMERLAQLKREGEG